jgi:hypothetical protein
VTNGGDLIAAPSGAVTGGDLEETRRMTDAWTRQRAGNGILVPGFEDRAPRNSDDGDSAGG